MEYVFNDGGREAAGYKGEANDCVARAIAIATGLPYKQVYDELWEQNDIYMRSHNDRVAKRLDDRGTSPRDGNFRSVYELYLATKGYIFHPTMAIGQGCKVHMRAEELPKGRIIVRLSRHLAAVVDGVLNDNHDCMRNGTRCVYGYYSKDYEPRSR